MSFGVVYNRGGFVKISKKVLAEYLKNPNFCPSCKSNDIIGDDWYGETHYQRCHCNSCEFVWRDLFEMVGVEED